MVSLWRAGANKPWPHSLFGRNIFCFGIRKALTSGTIICSLFEFQIVWYNVKEMIFFLPFLSKRMKLSTVFIWWLRWQLSLSWHCCSIRAPSNKRMPPSRPLWPLWRPTQWYQKNYEVAFHLFFAFIKKFSGSQFSIYPVCQLEIGQKRQWELTVVSLRCFFWQNQW